MLRCSSCKYVCVTTKNCALACCEESIRCGGDKKHFFHALIHFPVALKAFGQNKTVTGLEAVAGAIRVYHAATAFKNVTKLHITRAMGAEGAGCGFPDAAAELALLGAEAFQRQVGGVAVQGAAGLARASMGEVLGFNTNQGGLFVHQVTIKL